MESLKPYVEAYLAVIKKYAVFEGRARRKEFWTFFCCNLIIGVAFGILALIPIIGGLFYVVSMLYSLAILVPSLAIGARRLHDINRSGLQLLLCLIPLVGIIILIVFWVKEGDASDNQYGSNPKAA